MRKLFCLSVLALLLSVIAAAQTADEIVSKHIEAIGGVKRIQAVKSELTIGIAEINSNKIRVSYLRKRPNKVRTEISALGITQIQAYDGHQGWQVAPMKKDPELLTGDDLDDLKNDDGIDGPLVNYKEKGYRIELIGKEKTEGADTYNLKLTYKEGKVSNYYIDTGTFLEVKSVSTVKHKAGEEILERVTGDWKPVEGVMYAYFTELRRRGHPEQTVKIKIEKVELNGPVEDSLFEMPAIAAKPESPK
jgi:outer membrane lipoprotein-sorting protein